MVWKRDAVLLKCVKGVAFSIKGMHMEKFFCQNGIQEGKRLDLGTKLPGLKKRTRVPLAYCSGVY